MKARFPRLRASDAQRILAHRAGATISDLESLGLPSLDNERYAPTGPRRVDAAFLASLREQLMALARVAGYPRRSEGAFRAFDGRAAMALAELDMPLGEAIRSETWAWLAVYLVPHLVEWRFGKEGKPASMRRFAGSLQRNAIGRLWYRAYVMREPSATDPWQTMRLVTEDAHVAVLERTSIARDHRLARSVIRHWAGIGGGEQVLRLALIKIRLKAVVLVLSILSDQELEGVLGWSFQDATIQTAPRSPDAPLGV